MISKYLTAYKHGKTKHYVFSLFTRFTRFTAFFQPKWVGGRQGGRYFKFLIMTSGRFKFDMYLMKYPTGSFIDYHKDGAPEGLKHHRINFVLNKNFKGGKFIIKGKAQEGRIHKFRPDIYKHKVTKIKEGTRYVFSIGYLRKDNERKNKTAV